MTAETIHTCSYSCERPECIRAQRDELAARLTAETSNARWWVLERLRGVLEHGKMGDKCLIAPDLVTAAIAALSAPKPRMVGCEGDDGLIRTHPEAETCDVCAPKPEPAEAQPVAKLVNRKDADGGKTTTFIRPTSLGMDLPLGEYPLHLHPPPSAPVGVEGLLADLETIWHSVSDDKETNAAYQRLKSALAQQPAAVDEACAVAAIQFALNDPEGMTFLRLWNEGEFETLRSEWPEAPSSIYIGADPLATQHQEPTT